jgi:protein-tyrosine phosphatase
MFDIHCHILPGVDDGSRDLNESIEMLRAARDNQVNQIVCTPHCKASHFHPDRILSAYDALLPHANSLGIELILGVEMHWRKLSEIGTEAAINYCFDGTNMLLLEFSVDSMPANWQVVLNNLAKEGIKVIIAHPERYHAIQDDLDIAVDLKNAGCLLQLSSNFIDGGLFDKRKRTAISLLKEGLIDYVASDAHRPDDYARMPKALQIAQKYQ